MHTGSFVLFLSTIFIDISFACHIIHSFKVYSPTVYLVYSQSCTAIITVNLRTPQKKHQTQQQALTPQFFIQIDSNPFLWRGWGTVTAAKQQGVSGKDVGTAATMSTAPVLRSLVTLWCPFTFPLPLNAHGLLQCAWRHWDLLSLPHQALILRSSLSNKHGTDRMLKGCGGQGWGKPSCCRRDQFCKDTEDWERLENLHTRNWKVRFIWEDGKWWNPRLCQSHTSSSSCLYFLLCY